MFYHVSRFGFGVVSSSVDCLARCGAMVSKEVCPKEAGGRARRRRRAGGRARRRALRAAAGGGERRQCPGKCVMHAFVLRYRSALRKVPTQMPPHVRAGPPTKRVKRVSWRELSLHTSPYTSSWDAPRTFWVLHT